MAKERLGFCPHCGNDTPHRLRFSQRCGAYEYEPEIDDWLSNDVAYFVTTCATCDNLLLYAAEGVDRYEFAEAEVVWPKVATLHRYVPPRVVDIYREAISIRAKSPNAFAVQIRKALEAICDWAGSILS